MPGVFDRNLVTQVQQANDIVDVIAEHVNLTKKGREMVGLCPFHDDHSPSMNVNVQKQIFKCFACGAGGDVFKFVQMRENLTFPQAIERLAHRAGIKLPTLKPGKPRTRTTVDIDPNRLTRLNTWAAMYFQANLNEPAKGKAARDYLAQRGFSPETTKKWQIGLALGSPDDLVNAARKKGIPEDLLAGGGLAVTDRNSHVLRDKFINRLMFTITDATARIIGFGGRTLNDVGPKYINSPTTPLFDKSNCLYGLNHARHKMVETDLAVVVEGYTDCIMAHSKDCSNVVATLGTSFTEGHARTLRRYVKKVTLVFDSDTAGIAAANRALEICIARQIDIKLTFVPEGKDPADFLLAAGKEPFEKLLADAVDVFSFKWQRLTESLTADDSFAAQKTAVTEFLQTVASAVRAANLSPIEAGLVVNRLSKVIGAEPKRINAELRKIFAAGHRASVYKRENQKVEKIDLGTGLAAAAQKEILEVLLNEPGLIKIVKKQNITTEDFDTGMLGRIAGIVFDTLAAQPAPSLTDVLAAVDEPELGSAITDLAQVGQQKGNYAKRLGAAVDILAKLKEKKKKSEFKTAADKTKYLKHLTGTAAKENRHSIGLT